MTYEEITNKIEKNEISFEQAFVALMETGICPSLLNDDNGHWAVAFDGYQKVALGDEPEDIDTSFFVQKEQWKETIHEALLWALKDE